jgi:rhodanese-related sulfurtransferase
MNHSPGFLRLVNLARSSVEEITVDQARAMLSRSPSPVLLDVREDHEWLQGHAVRATHLGRGILERDLECRFPNPETGIIMYCGGGFRSALTCDAAQKLGYRKVYSLIGGYKALVQAGWPMASGD